MLYAASNVMAMEERRILSQERALVASAAGGHSQTTYRYAIGADGKRYIVGAEVSITASEKTLDSIPGGTKTSRSVAVLRPGGNEKVSSPNAAEGPNEAVIAELERTEREVITHEAAHQAAAGRFGGPATYSYTTGPDGRRYITGGEVQVHTPSTNDPEEALRNARQVMRAALAPGDPSGQDIAVAAGAAAIAASARAKLADGGESSSGRSQAISAVSARSAAEAYSAHNSPEGLWSVNRGFERPRNIFTQDAPIAAL
jgi:hypothetical protein